MSDDLSIEDFTKDFFTMPTFLIAPGCQSWDPTGWSVAPEYRAKWSRLFGTGFLNP